MIIPELLIKRAKLKITFNIDIDNEIWKSSVLFMLQTLFTIFFKLAFPKIYSIDNMNPNGRFSISIDIL